ncbi:putative GCV1-glycine decarboxylase, subunit T, mitochondrial [Ceraceosorus guamensis]|uniref:Aminomethyltransferase n=1 Tax=Ceraceosorus guamensis TaxID=1522189 RepID=A0A316VPD5_9BASI|nr:putative GCV1-glycine decarboxylase, subunit T, mitochondrial [Ceraceosorus guamensis]PWN39436.1 putative GCV1-glycine decarboxylase, subunit T, mitochondrial [Ceraceosorus guamensis]
MTLSLRASLSAGQCQFGRQGIAISTITPTHLVLPGQEPRLACAVGRAQARPSARAFHASRLNASRGRTGLYDFHVENAGKMVPFAGYDMPLTYGDVGQVASHKHVRSAAGLFDVGHMVQHRFSGAGSLAFLSSLVPTSLASLGDFSSTLSVLLNDNGGIIDDTVITKHAEDAWYVVTNAGRRQEDLSLFTQKLQAWTGGQVEHEVLEGWGLVALQGPESVSVLSQHTDADLNSLTFGRSVHAKVAGAECHIARGGYTGEDGFEISIPPERTVLVTQALLNTAPTQLAGLAARDSLRLEAGMCLYGHDLDESVSPIEGALAWVVSKDRREAADFPGAERILKELKEGPPRRRVGLVIEGAPAREGAPIFDGVGDVPIGVVTSGIPSPTTGQNIAMALVQNGQHKKGTKLRVEVRKKLREAEVVKMPWVPNRFFRGAA